MNPQIEFKEIHRHFKDQDVLNGLSFSVAPGTVFAFLGRNGAGKTTALRILLGFLKPSHGESSILGVNSQALDPQTRGRIGYISEGHRLYNLMRVKDILSFEEGTKQTFSLTYAEKSVARCGLPKDKLIAQLSRGQRAQLSLICALSSEPEVIIFDDPAMGLDVVMRREFLDVMIDLLSDRGCGVLFSSHILTDVERIADQVGILHHGGLIVNAALEELKARVEKRRWIPANGMETPPAEGVLKARKASKGLDLTLLDMTPEKEEKLQENGAQLENPVGVSLEDLFLDLTTGAEKQEIKS